MKNLPLILMIVSLSIFSGCNLKDLAGKPKAVNNAYLTEDDYVPPQVGQFVREKPPVPETSFTCGNCFAYKAYYTVPGEKAKLGFTYLKFTYPNYAEKQAKEFVDHWTKSSFEIGNCKDHDKEDLSVAQTPHYKITRREAVSDGEIVILQQDPDSLCNKEFKGEKREKIYYRKGAVVLITQISEMKEYDNAEQFINEYLKVMK